MAFLRNHHSCDEHDTPRCPKGYETRLADYLVSKGSGHQLGFAIRSAC